MTKLFIGAEGTLGIVTEVTIRLAPVIPTTVATARFPNVRNASEAVIEILNTGVGIRAPSHLHPSLFVLPTFTQNASSSSMRGSFALR
jgi:FAD/FMN-containing dehydrogenase